MSLFNSRYCPSSPFKYTEWKLFDYFNDRPDTKHCKDDKGNFIVEVFVPGFNKDNIEIRLKKQGSQKYIEIKGKLDERKLFKNIIIDNTVSDIKAKVRDGLLTLTLLYSEDSTSKIPIE